MKHKKHVNLVKPMGGKWGRLEIAFLGAPCGEIKKLSGHIISSLSNNWNTAYVDADHNVTDRQEWSSLDHGATAQLTNKITHYELQLQPGTSHYFNSAELVIVNGNHFKAKSQIAWVHPKKSLESKLDKLTNVGLVILDDEIDVIPEYLTNHLSGSDYQVLKRADQEKIIDYFINLLENNIPPLNGLVLIGGKSTRMQKDKSQLIYHEGLPQHEHMFNLLDKFCQKTFISVRDDEQAATYSTPTISDKFVGLGPYGGILSAFQDNPNTAWLVVAVDLPFVDKNTISQLVQARNIHKTATSFLDRKDEFPEPLITIWEPKAYPVLLEFLSKGYSCPRKALINSDVEIIADRDKNILMNVNTPQEYETIREQSGK
ncbi:MAG: NTP transferase domain-containing protein [Bacteroidota bacterium]